MAIEKAEKEAIRPPKKKEEKVNKKVQKKEEKAKKEARDSVVSLASHTKQSSNALVLIKAHSGCWDTLPPTLRPAHARAIPRAHSGSRIGAYFIMSSVTTRLSRLENRFSKD